MSSLKSAPLGSGVAPGGAALVVVYTTAIFLSAAMLFALQPMFTKMVLPALGGSPSIWSVAMVFFQALLLAGYAYAHVLATRVSQRRAALIHLAVLALAAASLPIALRGAAMPPADTDPSLWLIGVFTLSVGLPFFALSAHGPLLQAWFARSGHSRAADPYFLYAASNIGSFAALLGYPLLVEPFLGLATQSAGWSIWFVALSAIIACAGLLGGRARDGAHAVQIGKQSRISLATRTTWAALGFAPSGLLVAVTAHMSTDVGSAPLVWIAPLGLYLLSFPLAFKDRSAAWNRAWLCVLFWSGALVLMDMAIGSASAVGSLIFLIFHIVFFFASAVVCHGALYQLRPQGSALTAFYLSLSFGGMCGGLFAGLAAPLLFSSLAEYPLLVLAALACAPLALRQLRALPPRETLKWTLFYAISVAVIALAATLTPLGIKARAGLPILVGLPILLNWRLPGRSVLLASLGIIAIFIMNAITQGRSYRSFFGVTRIVEQEDGAVRTMMHGTTMHGAVRLRNADGTPVQGPPKPTTYFTFGSPLGETISAVRKARGVIHHAAIVGLGAGTLACHFKPSEPLTFYEIDSVVVTLASDRNLFPFLSDCGAKPSIVLGDARLTLNRQQEQSDVIVIDAFSSDAIPMHLLTREAVGVYLTKLAPRGVLAMHISNRILELSRIVARIGAEHGLVTYVRMGEGGTDKTAMPAPSMVAVLARSREDLRDLLDGDGEWTAVTPPASYPVWTDDRSTILTALIAKWR